MYRTDRSTSRGGGGKERGGKKEFIRGRFPPSVSSSRHLQLFDQLSTFEERRDGSEIVLPRQFQVGRLGVDGELGSSIVRSGGK